MILALLLAACDPTASLQALAKREVVKCDVAQTKKSKLFRRAMESKGKVAAKATGEFRFETKDSVLVVAGGKAKFGSETVAIDKLPKVSAFLSAFSGLFTGRTEGLLAAFSASAECTGTKTKVALTPKDKAFDDIAALTLHVDGETLTRIVLEEKNGDISDLALSGCAPTNEKLFE